MGYLSISLNHLQFPLSVYYAAAAKSLQLCPTLCDPIDGSPPGSPVWDSPGKNTEVGCHFLLQCMKVKSESDVTQSCLTLSNPMDCSPPGSSVHGVFQARVLEWGATAPLICPSSPFHLDLCTSSIFRSYFWLPTNTCPLGMYPKTIAS